MPRFGERFINTMAGEENPHRYCAFVRVVQRRGRLNPGTWWEMTDERGDFWLSNPANLVPADAPLPVRPCRVAYDAASNDLYCFEHCRPSSECPTSASTQKAAQ